MVATSHGCALALRCFLLTLATHNFSLLLALDFGDFYFYAPPFFFYEGDSGHPAHAHHAHPRSTHHDHGYDESTHSHHAASAAVSPSPRHSQSAFYFCYHTCANSSSDESVTHSATSIARVAPLHVHVHFHVQSSGHVSFPAHPAHDHDHAYPAHDHVDATLSPCHMSSYLLGSHLHDHVHHEFHFGSSSPLPLEPSLLVPSIAFQPRAIWTPATTGRFSNSSTFNISLADGGAFEKSSWNMGLCSWNFTG